MIKDLFSMCQISMKTSRWALRMHICGKMPLCSIAFAEKNGAKRRWAAGYEQKSGV